MTSEQLLQAANEAIRRAVYEADGATLRRNMCLFDQALHEAAPMTHHAAGAVVGAIDKYQTALYWVRTAVDEAEERLERLLEPSNSVGIIQGRGSSLDVAAALLADAWQRLTAAAYHEGRRDEAGQG
jgi:hypothetical protein